MGVKSGIATQIKAIQPNVLETHCHTHSVSLGVKEATTKSKVLRNTLDNVKEICVLIRFSPKEEKKLRKFRRMLKFVSLMML